MRALMPKYTSAPFAKYSHGVEVPAGLRWVRTSGQLGLEASGEVPDGSEAQAEICLRAIEAILGEAGMDRDDVVHLTGYVSDRAHMRGYMAARDTWLQGVEVLPSSTLLIVSGFTRPEFVVEIEAWAAAP